MSARVTRRWRGIVALPLTAVAVALVANVPSLLLVAMVGVAFAAYPLIAPGPDPTLTVSRELDATSAADGELVGVRTTVHNVGDRTLFDMRVIDGTPAMLTVAGGSPRCATTLRPGGSVTIEYDVRARPGRHRFRPTMVLCRDPSGSVEVERSVAADRHVRLDCESVVPSVPLRTATGRFPGRLVTDDAGHGIEFHSTTPYERGDPVSRIDWRRFAKTGALSTVSYHTERRANVLICVDARAESFRARTSRDPHAVAIAVDAAERIAEALFAMNHQVGIAGIGSECSVLEPRSGRDHLERIRNRLETEPAFSCTPPMTPSTGADPVLEGSADSNGSIRPAIARQLSTILTRIGSETQLFLLTPLCDEEAGRIAHSVDVGGVPLTVVSPDVTAAETVGARLSGLERTLRIRGLRNVDVPVVDWDPDTSLGSALATAERRVR